MSSPLLADFYLAGGTALALQIGHRISIDLDLFSPHAFDEEALARNLSDLVSYDLVNQSRNTLNLVVSGVKIDLIAYQYPLISELNYNEGIRLASLPDIACMKLSAIVSRGMKRDFVDLHFLLEHFTLGEMLRLFEQKYSQRDTFHVIKSLTFFDDADADPSPNLLRPISWDEIKKRIMEEVRKI